MVNNRIKMKRENSGLDKQTENQDNIHSELVSEK